MSERYRSIVLGEEIIGVEGDKVRRKETDMQAVVGRQTDRHTDRQKDRQADRQVNKLLLHQNENNLVVFVSKMMTQMYQPGKVQCLCFWTQ